MLETYVEKGSPIGAYARSLILIATGEYRQSVQQFERFLQLTEGAEPFRRHITEYLLWLIS